MVEINFTQEWRSVVAREWSDWIHQTAEINGIIVNGFPFSMRDDDDDTLQHVDARRGKERNANQRWEGKKNGKNAGKEWIWMFRCSATAATAITPTVNVSQMIERAALVAKSEWCILNALWISHNIRCELWQKNELMFITMEWNEIWDFVIFHTRTHTHTKIHNSDVSKWTSDGSISPAFSTSHKNDPITKWLWAHKWKLAICTGAYRFADPYPKVTNSHFNSRSN